MTDVSLFDRIEPLLRDVIPLIAEIANGQPQSGTSEQAARQAFLRTATWFMPNVDISVLVGHELDSMTTIYQLLEDAVPGFDRLPKPTRETAVVLLPWMGEDLRSAVTRQEHSMGWIRPKRILKSNIQSKLRGTVQCLIANAIYSLIREPKSMYKGQARVPGLEFDTEGLLAVLREDMNKEFPDYYQIDND
jgi:hypothetical protein